MCMYVYLRFETYIYVYNKMIFDYFIYVPYVYFLGYDVIFK